MYAAYKKSRFHIYIYKSCEIENMPEDTALYKV